MSKEILLYLQKHPEHMVEIEQIQTWADSFEKATFDHKRTIVKKIEVVLKRLARHFLEENCEEMVIDVDEKKVEDGHLSVFSAQRI